MKAVVLAVLLASALAIPSFTIQNNRFVRDGVPTLLFAGCLHYSRVHPAYWADRITRMRAMGLNAIETYVPWNFHNPAPGVYNFTLGADLPAFLQAAKDQNMLVMLRAGPYMCGEWEFGGLPAFLLNKSPAVTIRTYEDGYIAEVDKWWRVLLPLVKPFLYENGGPIVMVQVENEYGSYGNVMTSASDRRYMQHLVDLARSLLGNNTVLYTTDGGDEGYMSRGTLPGQVLTAGDFGPGSDPASSFSAQRKFNAAGKSVNICTEYYTGWLTHWGESMANTSSSGVAATLERIIALNGSFSLYMAHGGTNFGFWAGANGGGGTSYQPHITSYDYDGPISESGAMGYGSDGANKFLAIKQVLDKYPQPFANPAPAFPDAVTHAFGRLALKQSASFLEFAYDHPSATFTNQADPLPQEKYNQSMGFTLYSNTLPALARDTNLEINDVRDRAQVFVGGVYYGTIDRTNPTAVRLPAGAAGALDILVENMGRINYGHGMTDPKGIVGEGVRVGGSLLRGGWTVRTLPLEAAQLDRMFLVPDTDTPAPAFYSGTFVVDKPTDTYISTRGWHKGSVWINGFNLGRFWESRGPQHTLYVPAPVLRAGVNTLMVLELENASKTMALDSVADPQFLNNECDPSGPIAAGSVVSMFSAAAAYAGVQNFSWSSPGKIALASDPSLCVGVGPHTDPSTGLPALQLINCADRHAQVFAYNPSSKSIVVPGGQCVDISNHDTNDGASVEIYSCNGGDNQQFTYDGSQIASVDRSAGGNKFVFTACGASDPLRAHRREARALAEMNARTVH